MFWITLVLLSLSAISCTTKNQVSLLFSSANYPTATVTLNSGMAFTKATSVDVSLSSNDTLTEMSISIGEKCLDYWEAFAHNKTISLASSEGLQKVSVKVQNKDGFESDCIQKTITLDQSPPVITGSLSLKSQRSLLTQSPDLILPAVTDSLSGVAKYEVKLVKASNGEAVVDWKEMNPSQLFLDGLSLPDSEAESYYYLIRLTDAVGNVSVEKQSPTFIAGPVLSFTEESEGYSVQHTMVKVEFTLSRAPATPVVVSTKAVSGSAIGGINYYYPEFVSASTTIGAGATTAATYVSILSHAKPALDLNFEIEITGATNAVVASSKLPVTLLANQNINSYSTEASGYKSLSGSRGHMCAVTTSNKLECWGNSKYENGKTSSQLTPQEVSGAINVMKVSDGLGGHTCYIDNVGDLYCFGTNNGRELGDASYSPHATPYKHPSLTNIKKVSTGVQYTCVINSLDMIQCWGVNSKYQTGNTTTWNSGVYQMPGITKAIDVIAGVETTCAIDETGPGTRVVKCWGVRDTIQNNTPDIVTGLPNDVISLSISGTRIPVDGAEYQTVCALTESKKVYCWGHNSDYRRGSSSTSLTWLAANEVNLSSLPTKLKLGNEGACVLGEDTYLYCWGNLFPSLGTVTENLQSASPVKLTGVGSGVVDFQLNESTACALMSDSKIKCWGSNYDGEAGNGLAATEFTSTAFNAGDPSVRYSQVVAGEGVTCGLASDGKVRCWGINHFGQLGSGNKMARIVPSTSLNLPTVVKISGTYRTFCALSSAGRVYCWGHNSGSGFAGIGSSSLESVVSPTEIPALFTGGIAGLEDARDIAVGPYHSCALQNSGTVKCWGDPFAKRTGHDDGIAYTYPKDVAGISGVESIAVSNYNSCAVKSDTTTKSIYCWGHGIHGINGPSAGTADTHIPQLVETILTTKEVKLFLGPKAGCYIHDGATKCWGKKDNVYEIPEIGTLGEIIATPTEVPLLAGATHLSMQWGGGCATMAEGVKCWGRDPEFIVGSGQTTYPNPEINYAFKFGKAVHIARPHITNYGNGYFQICAVATTGDLKCWGAPYLGLGGHTEFRVNPPAYVKK